MISKQRWIVRSGGALALAGLVCFAAPAAAEPLRLAASHQQLATKSNPNGTATVTLAITLTHTGSVAAEDVRLILLKGPGLPVMPGENVLTVGALPAGQTVTLAWPVTVLAPVATRVPLIVIHAEGIAAGGTMPVSTGVLSRATNVPWPKASSAGSATEPVTADAICGSTERVSVDSAGNQANMNSLDLAISAGGRFVAFDSSADNLVPGNINGRSDIFVHDRKTGTTERVSVDSAGNQGNQNSISPAISATGRYVAFISYADNLVPGDTNGQPDVFVHDRKTGVTERASVDSAGNQGNYDSFDSAISADGRYVAFGSYADNLVPGNINGRSDIFVHDRKTGVTERASVDSAGNQGNYDSFDSAINADGRYVAFGSYADNLVPGDITTGRWSDIFVHDRKTGTTERVSVDSTGMQVVGGGVNPAISANGRYVAFTSYADKLVPGDTNGSWDTFVHDRKTGATERVSVDFAGNQVYGNSTDASIGADGRFVAFDSSADNLVLGDTNGSWDTFVHDRKTGAVKRVSVDSTGNQGDDVSYNPAISANGRYVAFTSYADNLVPGDTNAAWDVFVHR